jgi:hypothetical protein
MGRSGRAAIWTFLLAGVVCIAATSALTRHYFPDDGVRDVPRTAPLPEAVARDAGCPEDASEMPVHSMGGVVGEGVVPPDFQPVQLLRCDLTEIESEGSRSTYRVMEERAQTLPPSLLESFALPDQDYTDPRVACDLLPRPWVMITLVDGSGRAIAPRLPRQACGDTRQDVAALLEGIEWVPVARRTVEVSG